MQYSLEFGSKEWEEAEGERFFLEIIEAISD